MFTTDTIVYPCEQNQNRYENGLAPVNTAPGGGGGELPYEEYMGCAGKGCNICKKFQIGSVILMTQMTNQKKTELTDFFDLVWTKNPQFLENFLKMEAIFSQNSPQNCTLETSIRHKNPEKGPTFSSKIPERVDIEIL